MKNLCNTFLILLLLVNMSSCGMAEEVQDCEGENNVQQIQTFYHDEFGDVSCSLQGISNSDATVNLVIKTQADYEKYVICSSQLPAIDFDKYFILAGRYRHHQCAVFDSQQVLLCNNRIFYRVGMLEQICAAFTNVLYVTAIERKYENLPIVFDVKFLN